MKYFEYEEFDSPDIQGSGQMMSKELLSKLDMIREEFGKPIYINSGYRTEAHNEKRRWKTSIVTFKRFSCRYSL